MFGLAGELFSCIFWGIVISLILIGVFFFIPRSMNPHYTHTPLNFLVLIMGFCFLSFQCISLIGAFKTKKYIPRSEQLISSLGIVDVDVTTTAGMKEVGERIEENYPVLGKYVDRVMGKIKNSHVQVSNVAGLIDYYTKNIRRTINNFLWRRAGWITGGLVVIGLFFAHDYSVQGRRKVATNRRRRMPD